MEKFIEEINNMGFGDSYSLSIYCQNDFNMFTFVTKTMLMDSELFIIGGCGEETLVVDIHDYEDKNYGLEVFNAIKNKYKNMIAIEITRRGKVSIEYRGEDSLFSERTVENMTMRK